VRAFTTPEQEPLLHASDATEVALTAPQTPLNAPVRVVKATKVDSAVMERIKQCESQGNPNARNPHSTAKGLYQFLDSSWEAYGKLLWGSTVGKDVFSAKDNEELAMFVFLIEGTTPWESSAYCWR